MTEQQIAQIVAAAVQAALQAAGVAPTPTTAPAAAPAAVAKGFAGHQERREPCRLCEHNLGTSECCGLPAPAMIYKALEKAGVPRGPRRVAAVKAAKQAQKAAGLAGPAYSRACLDAALTAAGTPPPSVATLAQSKAMDRALARSSEDVDAQAAGHPAYGRLAALTGGFRIE